MPEIPITCYAERKNDSIKSGDHCHFIITKSMLLLTRFIYFPSLISTHTRYDASGIHRFNLEFYSREIPITVIAVITDRSQGALATSSLEDLRLSTQRLLCLQVAGPHTGPAGCSGEIPGRGRGEPADIETRFPASEWHHPVVEHAAAGHQGSVQPPLRQSETPSTTAGAGTAAGRG